MQLTAEQRKLLEDVSAPDPDPECTGVIRSFYDAIRALLADNTSLHRDNDRLCAEVKRLEAERDATERRALRARAWEYDPGGRD